MGTSLSKGEDQANYEKKARNEFKRLFEEFEFRCERAATMNYKASSDYDTWSRYLEYAAFGVGLLSAVALTWMSQLDVSASEAGTTRKSLKVTGCVSAGVSIFLEILAKGDFPRGILPTFSVRAEKHTEAGAGWQTLAHDTRAYMVLMNDPELGPNEFSKWYRGLAGQRKKVCTIAVVPETAYQNCDEETIEKLRKRRQIFEKFKSSKPKISDDATKS